jgi:hypothetical protein
MSSPAERLELRPKVCEPSEPDGADLVQHTGVGGRRRAADDERDILR